MSITSPRKNLPTPPSVPPAPLMGIVISFMIDKAKYNTKVGCTKTIIYSYTSREKFIVA